MLRTEISYQFDTIGSTTIHFFLATVGVWKHFVWSWWRM